MRKTKILLLACLLLSFFVIDVDAFKFVSDDIAERSCTVEYCVNTDKYYLNNDYIEPFTACWQNGALNFEEISWKNDNPYTNTHWLEATSTLSLI
jgi:hypothetical protein